MTEGGGGTPRSVATAAPDPDPGRSTPPLLLGPPDDWPARPDLALLAGAGRTRFAPAPTGLLHLGHVANAIHVWGIARALGAAVDLRIEDHDRGRARPEHERALLDDLAWLGFRPDRPPIEELRAGRSDFRQSDAGATYAAALAELDEAGVVYACRCSRATYAAWARAHGAPWSGPGCPGGCRERASAADDAGAGLRVALGEGVEAFEDAVAGRVVGRPAAHGDILVRDRTGGWTYPFAVVVDDLRHGVDLVVRGRDLLDDTLRQLRLATILGRTTRPRFAHHALILRSDGSKLSKSAGDTAIAELRAAGWSAPAVIGIAAHAVGLLAKPEPVAADEVLALVR